MQLVGDLVKVEQPFALASLAPSTGPIDDRAFLLKTRLLALKHLPTATVADAEATEYLRKPRVGSYSPPLQLLSKKGQRPAASIKPQSLWRAAHQREDRRSRGLRAAVLRGKKRAFARALPRRPAP